MGVMQSIINGDYSVAGYVGFNKAFYKNLGPLFPDYLSVKTWLRNKIDIYLFSSIMEGLPYSILESINLGVPIISSNAGGGVSELFKNKKDLVILNKFNQNNFNKAVIDYLRSPHIAEKFRNNAYLKLTKYFNIIDMQKKFKYLLDLIFLYLYLGIALIHKMCY